MGQAKTGQGRERRWSAAVARAVLTEQARSGLSIYAFAQERGLDPQRLYFWRGQLAKRVSGAANSFVEVMRPATARAVDGIIEVVLCSGETIRLRGEVDRERLRTVIEVMRSC